MKDLPYTWSIATIINNAFDWDKTPKQNITNRMMLKKFIDWTDGNT